MECISYNYVKVRVNLPPLGPVLLLLVGEAPLLVGDVPLLLGDVPLLVGDVPLLVGDVPLLVEEASLLVVGVFVLSGCFFYALCESIIAFTEQATSSWCASTCV